MIIQNREAYRYSRILFRMVYKPDRGRICVGAKSI